MTRSVTHMRALQVQGLECCVQNWCKNDRQNGVCMLIIQMLWKAAWKQDHPSAQWPEAQPNWRPSSP